MGRSILGGRNWESWTADPYLAGEAVRVTVSGMQEQGVTALVKHFYGSKSRFRPFTPPCFSPTPPIFLLPCPVHDTPVTDHVLLTDEQEFLRIGADNGGYFPANESQTISSNMDDATAHGTLSSLDLTLLSTLLNVAIVSFFRTIHLAFC